MVRYKPYTMADVLKVESNGLNVVSTFSGGGGSSMGYKLAGFNVIYANEFVPEAQNTYRANFPKTYLDTRDIRQVKPDDILEMCNGNVDVLDGSPPCCSFSVAGKGSDGWGEVRKYSDLRQRTDDLFFEWLRLLNGIKPKAFLCENVPALAQGKNKGVFRQIVGEMKKAGYKVQARIVFAEYLGVPQARHRLLFMGIRNDINHEPVFPKPFQTKCVLGTALEGVEIDSTQAKWIENEAKRLCSGKIMAKVPKNPKKIYMQKIMLKALMGNL